MFGDNRFDSEGLDRHITGDYGERSVPPEDPDEFVTPDGVKGEFVEDEPPVRELEQDGLCHRHWAHTLLDSGMHDHHESEAGRMRFLAAGIGFALLGILERLDSIDRHLDPMTSHLAPDIDEEAGWHRRHEELRRGAVQADEPKEG